MHGILRMIFLHVFSVFQTPQENLHVAENNWISVATKSCVTAYKMRHSGKKKKYGFGYTSLLSGTTLSNKQDVL